jgi:hypothetical protein
MAEPPTRRIKRRPASSLRATPRAPTALAAPLDDSTRELLGTEPVLTRLVDVLLTPGQEMERREARQAQARLRAGGKAGRLDALSAVLLTLLAADPYRTGKDVWVDLQRRADTKTDPCIRRVRLGTREKPPAVDWAPIPGASTLKHTTKKGVLNRLPRLRRLARRRLDPTDPRS